VAELSWRPPTRDDDPSWLALLLAMEAVDRRGEVLTQDDLDDEWASVWSHPATDALFAWEGPHLVAFSWIKTQVGSVSEHKLSPWGGVAPSHRGRGIGGELLGRQVARCREVAAGLDPAFAVHVGLEARHDQHDLLALADRMGFVPERRFLEVARPAGLPLEPAALLADLDLRRWTPAVDEATRLAHVEAFADHWGTEPATAESWAQWYTGHRGYRADLSHVAVDRSSGTVVAFCLAAAYPNDWDTGPREAWVQSLGTRPAWRGKGVARAVLTATLRDIPSAADGFERAILGVDAENPTGALGLYRSLGFEDARVTVRLGLRI
jgi:mycothiol synthase